MAQKIPLSPVTSSNIESIGYDGAKQSLAVKFRNGNIYHFSDIPQGMAHAFLASDSKGKHFNATFRGKHAGQRMTGYCGRCGYGPGWGGDQCHNCGSSAYTLTETADAERS